MEEEKKVEPLNAEDFLSVHGDFNAAAASEVLEEEDCLVIDNEVDFPENPMEISQNVNHLFDDIDEREYEGGNSKRIEDLKTKGEQSVEEMRQKIISLEERQKNQALEYYLTQERYFKENREYYLMLERHHKQATENYLSQERHHSQALERDLTQERHHSQALERDFTHERQQKEALKRDLTEERQQKEALKRDLTEERQQKEALKRDLTHERQQKEALERDFTQERQQKEALERDLTEERQQKEALERDLTEERQQKEALEQDIKTVTQEHFNLILENIDLGEKISSDKYTRECKICFSNEANMLFQPCNHISACQDCFQQLQVNNYNYCPICMKVIAGIIKLHYS